MASKPKFQVSVIRNGKAGDPVPQRTVTDAKRVARNMLNGVDRDPTIEMVTVDRVERIASYTRLGESVAAGS